MATRQRVEFRAQRLIGETEGFACERGQFPMNGKLPAPAP
jgi:hypothetical protein